MGALWTNANVGQMTGSKITATLVLVAPLVLAIVMLVLCRRSAHVGLMIGNVAAMAFLMMKLSQTDLPTQQNQLLAIDMIGSDKTI